MRHGRASVYGPVPSRRLGASLGVDVVPPKVCSYDCIYCQLGPTRTLSGERETFYPVEEVLADVKARLALWPPPDTITIAGSGEPTLYAELGRLIRGIKEMAATPVALLTNGGLFGRPDVREDARSADIVLPSLDAGDEAAFVEVNRPVPGTRLAEVVEGLIRFRSEFAGRIWLEVMLVAGVNDTPDHVGRIASLARRFAPDRIQLNTPVRPTFDERAAPIPAERLAQLCGLFSPRAEAIEEVHAGVAGPPERVGEAAEVVGLLRRRPCTMEDVSTGLGLHPNDVVKLLTELEHAGEVHRVLREGYVYWRAVDLRTDGAAERAR
ncbi:MAG: radical SAM protein [Acidobacteriota bacterium]